MADDDEGASNHDPVADLAALKPAVERLRGLLQAAAAAEEAAASADDSVTGEPEGLENGSPPEEPAEEAEPSADRDA